MKKILFLLSLVLYVAALAVPAGATGAAPGIAADEAFRLLQAGHSRYLEGNPRHPHQGAERRALTTGQGQHPLAALLACSDSRVPPEIIFDQGIGDLFVVRVAGNVAGANELGSLEYAVDHLATPLVVVLGHTQCGAIRAALEGAKPPSNLAALVSAIKPAVEKAREAHAGAAPDVLLKAAITENIWQAVENLLTNSPVIRDKVREGQTRVVGALYEIDSGQVQWLGPHPQQAQLLGARKGTARTGKKRRKAPTPEE